jgi:hypothetical protein
MTGESGHDDSETPEGMGDDENLTRDPGGTSGPSGSSSKPSHIGGSTSGTNLGSTTGGNTGGSSGNR